VPRLQSGACLADSKYVDSSRALPTGVVTFLLTDIEGSTRLWEREPDAMREALSRHDAIVGACVRRQNGHVLKTKGEGDSVFAVFRHVRDAVCAALVIQCALAVERWTTSTPLRVRMAIHTGQVELRDGDYYGPIVNRCARLRAQAKGGQVLLSAVTAQLVQGQLPSGATLQDLGTRQLKDLSAPERVWQLIHPQLVGSAAPGTMFAPRSTPTAAPARRAFALTDHLNCSADGRQWGKGVRHRATSMGKAETDDRIRCYTSPRVAALLNLHNERFRLPRLWEAIVDVEPKPGEAIVACGEVTTTRQVALPALTGLHHARFAVLCAKAALDGGAYAREFANWADGWLAGQDNSGVAARALADELEREAHDGVVLVHPELLMAANAARAATHASRLSWLVGRARDAENTRATDLASEVLHTALRLTRLDVPALAEQVLPQAAPVLSAQPTSAAGAPDRILKALPT
jgi:class 3 adenylate cyclase